MQEFLTVVFGFPTLPYSIVLAVAVLYWHWRPSAWSTTGLAMPAPMGRCMATHMICRDCPHCWRVGAWVGFPSCLW